MSCILSGSTRGKERKQEIQSDNPFFAALGATHEPSDDSAQDNVFFQQLNSDFEQEQHEEPVTMVTTQPLSYAAAVKSEPNSDVNPFLLSPVSPVTDSSSIHLKGVPNQLNNVSFLKEHFNKFGPVRDIKCHPEKKFADVHFTTKVSTLINYYCYSSLIN